MKTLYFSVLGFIFLWSCRSQPESSADTAVTPSANTEIRHVVGIGKIIPEKDILPLSSPVNGIIRGVYKTENDSVSKGTVILELDHAIEDANIARFQVELQTQQNLIQAEQASLRENQIQYDQAKTEWSRLKTLFNKGAESKQKVDDAETRAASLQASVQRAEAAVNAAKSRLREIRASLGSAQVERDQKIIRSPVNGRILTCEKKAGESVFALQPFLQIRPEGKTIALCEIDESYADQVSVGQRGWIRKVGTTDTLSTGTVFFTYSFLNKKSLFTDQAGEREDRRVRAIKMSLDQPDALLLNARVECVIDIAEPNK